jgi:hypothetical protein
MPAAHNSHGFRFDLASQAYCDRGHDGNCTEAEPPVARQLIVSIVWSDIPGHRFRLAPRDKWRVSVGSSICGHRMPMPTA